MNSEERITVSKRLRLCFLRLRESHRVAACNTKGSCQKQAVMDDIILDRTGSQHSFVKKSVPEALNLKGPLESVSIEPLGNSGGGCKRVRRISESPNLLLEIKQFSHLAPLKLAEDFTNLYTSFDVLIWLDYYYEFIDQKIIKDLDGEPIAIHSTLGWIVCDSIPENVPTTRIRAMFAKI
ncbi:hypothetical protein T05_11569 [Trichinella murrelli]|uniref:Uncharacterized protein n=1 Tax=Trichinella murrelli TaxID=144512 RepID=A0A0V0U3B5_9BILA|nr:hypothetical protein T05_11569 [Trichinella murrelli]